MSGDLIYADGQMQFKDYLLGDDTITFLDAINGWDDLPSVDSGNALKPSSHGAWVGQKLAGERVITWEGRFAATPEEWAAELKRLRSTFSLPLGTEEYEIVVRMHDEVALAFGTVSGRLIPGDRAYGYYGANLSFQFECSDPRKYSLAENVWQLSLPASSTTAGLIYPLTYPLDYGVFVSTSSGTLVNDGDVMTPVTLTFSGAMTNPAIENLTLGARLEFDIVLTATDTLTIDTRTGTVLLNGTADRLYTRTVNSSPIFSFGLLPGNNDMNLTAASWTDPAGLVISWRDATL